jgi:hypothetical protein
LDGIALESRALFSEGRGREFKSRGVRQLLKDLREDLREEFASRRMRGCAAGKRWARISGSLDERSFDGEPLQRVASSASSLNVARVSTEDRTINPDLKRFMAKRMGAKTMEIRASHLSLISHPDEITQLILEAAGQRA